MNPFVGSAGWSIPSVHAAGFDSNGSHLVRYASRFNAVEINSSFHRPHQTKTYARWASLVPSDFRFAVKIPKQITHERRLVDVGGLIDAFVDEVRGLGDKLGPLLVQLPPSLEYSPSAALPFFKSLRCRVPNSIVCEPRHASWFSPKADTDLMRAGVSRVAADPAIVSAAACPGGSGSVAYFRLHGSPHMYYSAYTEEYLETMAQRLAALANENTTVWCIFDNTTSGAATGNALYIRSRLCSIEVGAAVHGATGS